MRVRFATVAVVMVCLAVLTACGSGSHGAFTSPNPSIASSGPNGGTPDSNPTQPGGSTSDPGQTPAGGTTDPGQTPGGGTNDPGQTPGGGTTDPGQNPGGGTVATLASIQVSPASFSLASGSTTQFSATGTYSDGSTKDITSSVTWSSSATAAATVSSSGVVTALGPGQATITASSGSATPGSGTVSVLPSALTISMPGSTLGLGQSQQLTAIATYTDGPHDVTASVTWSSSDSATVTVDTSGLATAVAIGGPVTITGTLGSMAATTSITVGPPVLTQVRIAPVSAYGSYCGTSGPPYTCSMGTHQVLQFLATGVYSDGHNADVTATATWSVDEDHSGSIRFLQAGLAFGETPTSSAATVSASVDGISGTATLSVTSARVASSGVMVAPDAWTLPVLATNQFAATALWTDGSAQDITNNPVASWASDNTSVAIVGPSSSNTRLAQGMAQGLVAGTANISVTMDGESASASLTVIPAQLTTISVTPASASIPMVMVQQYTAVGTFTDNTVSPPQSTQADITNAVTWTAADPSIALISSGGAHPGLAVPLHVGQTSIVATLPGAPAVVSTPVTLNVTGSQLTTIVVTPVSPKVGIGAAVQFAATARFDDSSVYDLTDYFNWSGLNPWSSSNSAVASISNIGLTSTLGLGKATIRATVAGVSGSTELTVTPAQLKSVIILPSTQNPSAVSFDPSTSLPIQPTLGMTPHSRIQLKAYGYYTDQTFQALSGVIWSTPPPRKVVVVTGSGYVIAKPHSAGGTVTIKATVPGSTIEGSASLVVAGAIDTALQLLWNGAPVPAQVAAGTGLQFSAWATSGGTPVQDVTTFVQWSTSDPECAVINSTGFATGRSVACTAQITATYNNQTTVASKWTLFTVTKAQLTSISIAPANSSLANPPVIPLGASQQLSATGSFNDATTQDLTGQVSWTSSDIAVVVISRNTPGLAVSSGAGTATVSATLAGNPPGTTQVTVTAPPTQ